MKPQALGVIGIRLSHTLTPGTDTAHLVRALQLDPRGPVKFAAPLIVLAFRAENARMMKTLKAFAESTIA